MDENSFKLNLPPFLNIHLVFNVELLHPYFMPLLDISKVEEHLALIEFNLHYLEHAIMDDIMETKMKSTHQWSIQLYQIVSGVEGK
jgi:hypothetical protein